MPLLMASTGSNFEAEIAGIIPEINPINAANPEPKSIFEALNTNSKSNAEERISAIIQTKNIPTIPPISDKMMASNKN